MDHSGNIDGVGSTVQVGLERGMRAGKGVSPLEVTHSNHLRKFDIDLYQELDSSLSLEATRLNLFSLLSRREFFLLSDDCSLNSLERSNALNCIKVLKNLCSERNERLSGHSTIEAMREIIRDDPGEIKDSSRAMYLDFFYIVLGSLGCSDIYREEAPPFLSYEDRAGAKVRSDYLDEMAERCMRKINSYRSGLEPEIVSRRVENRTLILDRLGGDLDDWFDYRWHQRNVLRDVDTIASLVSLSDEDVAAIELANSNMVPFGITPYYLSLFDGDSSRKFDHAVRAQVIPPLSYVRSVLEARRKGGASLDFMKEGQTSPSGLITRRYPMIAILKPFNSCAQICVYCQRNWEISNVQSPEALASPERISTAIEWFRSHPMISEVLITGGDPALMEDRLLANLLLRLSNIEHIKRIRIGTRLPVVLPMRFTDQMVESIGRFRSPPENDLCVVTHFEHSYEVTPDSLEAVQKLRKAGIATYNQQVFTIENSRKFETAALRLLLKQTGVDPYYTFNTKGKEETMWYRVPIARLLQERKEEARILPGLSRTDKPVFNIPALGKNDLQSWEHHDLIMISPRGERIYEFHPWEKNITIVPTFIYADVPILDFLMKIRERGEDLEDYRSIWYYF